MHIIKNMPHETSSDSHTVIFLTARQMGRTEALKRYVAEMQKRNKPFKKKKLKKS